MKKLLPIFIMASVTFVSLPAEAQVEQALPALRAPDKTRWVVTVENAEPEQVTDPESRTRQRVLQQTVGEKDGNIYRILNRYTTGEDEEFWILPQMQFLKSKDSNTVLRLLHGDSASYDLSESDFPELYWAAGQVPRLVEIEGVQFLLVEIPGSEKKLTRRQMTDEEQIRQLHLDMGMDFPNNISTGQDAPSMLRLLLNPKTKLPVRFEEGNSIRTYRFEPSRGLQDLLPPEFNSAIRAWHQRHIAAMRPPSEPRVRNRTQQ